MPPIAVQPLVTPRSEDRSGRQASPTYDLSYRDRFWSSRAYEDHCDRLALRALLPVAGQRLVDLGAGFGRLVDEYRDFESVDLVDVSPTMLDAARERVAAMPNVAVIEADVADLPMADESVDTVVAVRLLVHVAQPDEVFREIARVLRPGGTAIIEYANRRHLLSILRYVARRQVWSPRTRAPIQYLPGHFAHQPSTIDATLRTAGLAPDARLAVSMFRSDALKRLVPARVLAIVEAPLQGILGRFALSPSIYVRAHRVASTTARHSPDRGPTRPHPPVLPVVRPEP